MLCLRNDNFYVAVGYSLIAESRKTEFCAGAYGGDSAEKKGPSLTFRKKLLRTDICLTEPTTVQQRILTDDDKHI